ncbi:MAG: hypothetical protein PHF75_09820, partial [Gallionella sp.]|nr:hypothetical protein [Gallionella sp.]
MTFLRLLLTLALLANFTTPLYAAERTGMGAAGMDQAEPLDKLDALASLLAKTPDTADHCLPESEAAKVLQMVAQIRHDRPARLVTRIRHSIRYSDAQVAAIEGRAMGNFMLHAIACRLEWRARLPTLSTQAENAGQDSLSRLFDATAATLALEENLSHFAVLAGNTSEIPRDALLAHLNNLYAYTYGQTPELGGELGGIVNGLTHMQAIQLQLPDGLRDRLAARLIEYGQAARAELLPSLMRGSQLLERYWRKDDLSPEQALQLASWLAYLRDSWFSARPDANPCAELRTRLSPPLTKLVNQHNYPRQLTGLPGGFDAQLCHRQVQRMLSELRLPPDGAVFVLNRNKVWQFHPQLAGELDALAAMGTLGFMQPSPPVAFRCQAGGSGFSPAGIAKAQGYLAEYTTFARQRGGLANDNGRAEHLARHALERRVVAALNQTQNPVQDSQPMMPAQINELLELQIQLVRLLPDTARQFRQCVSLHAGEELARIASVMGEYRLELSPNPDGRLYDIGSRPLLQDFLARQRTQVQLSLAVAEPWLKLLENTDDDSQTTRYWR